MAPDTLLVVGSYTHSYGPFRAEGEGLTLVSLTGDGALRREQVLALPNPSYIRMITPDRFAVVLECNDDRAGIAFLRIDRKNRRLACEDQVTIPGRIPCHLDLDPTGRWLAGACYGSGEIFLVSSQGDGPAHILARHEGSGPHPVRQVTAHPHATRFSPDGRWLVVPDLGTDTVTCYALDGGKTTGEKTVWQAPRGSGPRLVQFTPDGKALLLVHELSSELSLLGWSDGTLVPIDRISAVGPDAPPGNTTAALRLHPTKSLAGVSNRGADTLDFFSFDLSDGLARHSTRPSGGQKPRDFEILNDGKHLLVVNQDSHRLLLEPFDLTSGAGVVGSLEIASPSTVRQVPHSA